MVNEGTGMSSVGGAAQYGAGWPPEPGLRREPPRALSLAYLLIHTLFGFTVLGGLGLLLTAASHDALDGGVIARVAYAAAPGTLGWWLVRRSRQGGGPWGGTAAKRSWINWSCSWNDASRGKPIVETLMSAPSGISPRSPYLRRLSW